MTLKISISGVRGIVPESLSTEVCLDFAKAFGTYLRGGKVVVGTDPRASSEPIKKIVFAGLLSAGCQPVDLGICPTPTVGIMVKKLKAKGGMVITASHNPLPWNGLKFMREDGIFLNEKQAQKLIDLFYSKEFKEEKPQNITRDSSADNIHIGKILKAIPTDPIRKKKLKVAIDCCNGAGSEIVPKLLKKLGCLVEAINCDLSLTFPHAPEPIAENLNELCYLVKNKKADIGFAFDSDADRLAIVSEEGNPLGEELTLALAIKYVLGKKRRRGSKIVTNLSTTKAIDDIAREFGAKVIRTKIGEVHVAEKLKQIKGAIGGEGNGGVIYPPVGFNRDALAGLALILNLMADTGQKISQLAAGLPQYHMLKKKVECPNVQQAAIAINRIKEQFKEANLILTDGVKIVFPSGWVHVRASNTEPVIRIIAEAEKKEEAEKLISQVFQALG